MIIHTAERKHSCQPGWTSVKNTNPEIPFDRVMQNVGAHVPAGSVWECTCGHTYVAYYATHTGWMIAMWRPERRRERRRRLKEPSLNGQAEPAGGDGMKCSSTYMVGPGRTLIDRW